MTIAASPQQFASVQVPWKPTKFYGIWGFPVGSGAYSDGCTSSWSLKILVQNLAYCHWTRLMSKFISHLLHYSHPPDCPVHARNSLAPTGQFHGSWVTLESYQMYLDHTFKDPSIWLVVHYSELITQQNQEMALMVPDCPYCEPDSLGTSLLVHSSYYADYPCLLGFHWNQFSEIIDN